MRPTIGSPYRHRNNVGSYREYIFHLIRHALERCLARARSPQCQIGLRSVQDPAFGVGGSVERRDHEGGGYEPRVVNSTSLNAEQRACPRPAPRPDPDRGSSEPSPRRAAPVEIPVYFPKLTTVEGGESGERSRASCPCSCQTWSNFRPSGSYVCLHHLATLRVKDLGDGSRPREAQEMMGTEEFSDSVAATARAPCSSMYLRRAEAGKRAPPCGRHRTRRSRVLVAGAPAHLRGVRRPPPSSPGRDPE